MNDSLPIFKRTIMYTNLFHNEFRKITKSMCFFINKSSVCNSKGSRWTALSSLLTFISLNICMVSTMSVLIAVMVSSHTQIHRYKRMNIRGVVLWFFGNFELMKFCQNFGETFGKFWERFVAPSSPPSPPQKNTWEIVYTALCKIYFLPKLW